MRVNHTVSGNDHDGRHAGSGIDLIQKMGNRMGIEVVNWTMRDRPDPATAIDDACGRTHQRVSLTLMRWMAASGSAELPCWLRPCSRHETARRGCVPRGCARGSNSSVTVRSAARGSPLPPRRGPVRIRGGADRRLYGSSTLTHLGARLQHRPRANAAVGTARSASTPPRSRLSGRIGLPAEKL